ncbi:MAG: M28 family peptidase [Bacteroidota bacterium]
MKKQNTILLLFLFFSFDSQSQNISKLRLQNHLEYLASDELEGRETTYRGQKIAAKYIANHFRSLGLKNPTSDNSFSQPYPLIHSIVSDKSNLSIYKNKSLIKQFDKFGEEYIPLNTSSDTIITNQVVFVGYGISSKNGYSDYDSNFSYKGKILLALRGLPNDSNILSQVPLRAGSPMFKRITASQKGAAALLIIDESKEYSFTDSYKDNLNNLLRGSIYPPSQNRNDIPVILISKQLANKLLASSKTSVDKLEEEINKTKSNSLKSLNDISVSLDLKRNVTTETGENILGVIEGSDPILKNEFVVVTAHYDHVGKNLSTNVVFNGADDDASGTSAVLELAEVFSKIKTKRSIIFMAVSGEEKGLLGSSFYTDNPIIPLENTVANINIDMIGRTDPKYDSLRSNNYVYVIGSDKLSLELDSILNVANKKSVNLILDYKYNDDNDPNQFYRRSDHYNFAKKNIPVIFFFNGTHVDYHQSTDDIDKIDFDALQKRTELVYTTILEIANATSKPKLK